MRATTCRKAPARDSPRRSRPPRANGTAMPTMKRNAGNTTSVIVMPSVSDETCFSQAGAVATPATSFTKSISRTSAPRRRSIDWTRAGRTGASLVTAVLATWASAGIEALT